MKNLKFKMYKVLKSILIILVLGNSRNWKMQIRNRRVQILYSPVINNRLNIVASSVE